jgi:hypothetical protein
MGSRSDGGGGQTAQAAALATAHDVERRQLTEESRKRDSGNSFGSGLA